MLQGLVLCRKMQIPVLRATYCETVPTFAASDSAPLRHFRPGVAPRARLAPQ